MKNRGFTLIELLAVLVILSIIASITTPIVWKLVEKARKETFLVSAYGFLNAGRTYYVDYVFDKGRLETAKLFETENGVWLGDALSLTGKLPKYGNLKINKNGEIALAVGNGKWCASKTFTDSIILIEEVAECELPVIYEEELLNGADPQLVNNMIPAIISDGGTVTVANIKKEWYKYEKKEWANAVVVENNTGLKAGDVIPETNILSYFVWIPRYRYELWNAEGKNLTGIPFEIKIEFENNEETKSNGNKNGEWLTHPSFTFGDREINGYWVGKFETGYQQGKLTEAGGWTLGGASKSDADINGSKIVIKPNIYSWTSISVSNIFKTVQSMASTDSRYGFDSSINDPHMMKNMEWGAVAYLTHSKYGINKEVNINNCAKCITGWGGPDGNSSYDSLCNNIDGTNLWNQKFGKLSSTTGNITGIYDMNGGRNEYVMGAMYQNGNANILVKESGFVNGTESGQIDNTIIDKYIDKYGYNTNWYNRSRGMLGDATTELGPWYKSDGSNPSNSDNISLNTVNSWYSDNAYFVDSSYPWFSRGGKDIDGSRSGLFAFSRHTGKAYGDFTFRVVVIG